MTLKDPSTPDHSSRERWNARYSEVLKPALPSRVLTENRHLLPKNGKALEIACGLGANAWILANHGLDTLAWDISEVAVNRLNVMAREDNLPLHAEVRNVVASPPPAKTFDVVVVSRFLERELAVHIQHSLKPGGLLFYQTFVRAKVHDIGPNNPAYRLGENELLAMFSDLHLLVYREEGRTGNLLEGFRDEAMLVGVHA